MKKQSPEKLKTRPDLGDQEWIVWLSMQPENKGLLVPELYRKMFKWCQEKGQTPTRRRLLNWLDRTREEIPITYEPPYLSEPGAIATGSAEPTPQLPDCNVCKNERFVKQTINPDAPYDWAREGMVRCTACQPGEEVSR